MKYKDPVTGELKDITIKSGDTLPIGTIVDFDGDIIPDGYEEATEASDVVNSLEGNEVYRAPSVKTINEVLNGDIPMENIKVANIECKNVLDTSNIKGKNGITATKGDKGLWVFNGTPTENYTHFLDINEDILVDGKPHTFSSTNYNTQIYLQVERKNKATGAIAYHATQEKPFTLNIDKNTYSYGISINTHSITNTGTVSNLEVGWQIEVGKSATEYTEYKIFDNSKLIKNEKTNSKTNTYSCNYINDIIFKRTTETDLDNLTVSGIYTLNASTNVPAGNGYYNVAIFYYDTNPNYAYMFATKLGNSTIYVRHKNNNTWSSWEKITPIALS